MTRAISFDPKQGYPAARKYQYECLRCGDVVESMPTYDEDWQCKCKNVKVDPDAGRVSVEDDSKLRILEKDDG